MQTVCSRLPLQPARPPAGPYQQQNNRSREEVGGAAHHHRHSPQLRSAWLLLPRQPASPFMERADPAPLLLLLRRVWLLAYVYRDAQSRASQRQQGSVGQPALLHLQSTYIDSAPLRWGWLLLSWLWNTFPFEASLAPLLM